ncbi:hypothetical protein Goari_012013, partial [Gossypium aridum]|nr:hypothetical protein [Gossypium aridum]
MASTFLALPKTFTSNKPTFPSLSTHKLLAGTRRNSLRINAVATKWEPTKVVPQADRVLIRLQELPEVYIGYLSISVSTEVACSNWLGYPKS